MSRGRRSAADLAQTPINPGINWAEPADIPDLARRHRMPRREVERALARAARRGEAVQRPGPNGALAWFCAPTAVEY